MAQAEKTEPTKARTLNKEVERQLSWAPANIRRGAALFVGRISTPFVVDQDKYFNGKRDLDEIEDE